MLLRLVPTAFLAVLSLGAQAEERPTALAGATGPTAGWKLPMTFAQIPEIEREAIFRAAGYDEREGQWKACDGNGDVFLDEEWIAGGAVRDLNGDGLPEVIVGDGGTFCHGMTGQGYVILTPAAGGWRVIHSNSGIPSFLETRGADGWPDIEVGGPGFCFPVLRWTGTEYALHRQQYEGQPCEDG